MLITLGMALTSNAMQPNSLTASQSREFDDITFQFAKFKCEILMRSLIEAFDRKTDILNKQQSNLLSSIVLKLVSTKRSDSIIRDDLNNVQELTKTTNDNNYNAYEYWANSLHNHKEYYLAQLIIYEQHAYKTRDDHYSVIQYYEKTREDRDIDFLTARILDIDSNLTSKTKNQ